MALNDVDHDRLLERLEDLVVGNSVASGLLDDVLPAYGDADLATLWSAIAAYAEVHRADVERLQIRQAEDRRRLPWLSDPALICVLERLEHNSYRLRRAWAQTRDPAELRRLASLWGVRIDP